jgi:hypothetical protein
MILIRRTFIQQMQAYLEQLPANPDQFPLEVWRKMIEPHINDPLFMPGSVMVTRSQGIAVDFRVPFKSTFDGDFLNRAFGGVYSHQQDWIKSATREAYLNWRSLLTGALKRAEQTKVGDLKAMLELTGVGFSPVVNVVYSRLLRLEEQSNPRGLIWKPDIGAMDFVGSIGPKAAELQAIKEIGEAEKAILLSGATLLFFAPASIPTRIACTLLNGVFAGEALITVDKYLDARGELRFAQGASAVLGTDRLIRAKITQIPEWAVALSVIGAVAGLGGETLAWIEHISLSRALSRVSEILPALKDDTFNAFMRLGAEDKAAVLALVTEARAIRQNPIKTLTDTHRKALEIGAELERKSKWKGLIRSTDLGGPAGIFAPTVLPDADILKLAIDKAPAPWMPKAGSKFMGVDTAGKPAEIQLGKLLGKGLFAHVYEIVGRPDVVIKVYWDIPSQLYPGKLARSAKQTVEIARRVAQRLEERGIPQLEILEFHPDAPKPYVIQRRLPKDGQVFDLAFRNIINEFGVEVDVCAGLKGGKKLTPTQQRGFLRTCKMFGAGEDPVIMEDAHIGNFCFVPKGNTWEAMVIDQDRVGRWQNLMEEPEMFGIVMRLQERPSVEPFRIYSLEERIDPDDAIKLIHAQKGQLFWPSADFFMEKVLEFKRYIHYNRKTKEFESFILDMKIVEEFYPHIRRHVDLDFTKPLPEGGGPVKPPSEPLSSVLTKWIDRALLPRGFHLCRA